ncbi:MAG TPA: hypothetical protein VGB52_10595 [Actinomycetota bacterium]
MDATGFQALFELFAVATPPRTIVRVRGEKTLAFLHDVATSDLAALRPGEGASTCFLDEKGRVQAEARALALDDGSALLDAEPAAAGYLTGWLARIAPLSGCEITDETAGWQVAAVRGPKAGVALGLDADLAEHAFVQRDSQLLVRVEWGLPGFDVFSPSPEQLVLDDAIRVDDETFEAARIAAGRPRFGIDITEETLVNETPLLARAVAMTKGCYPGQESVARVHNLGKIRRHLVGLDLAVPASVAPGAAVLVGEDEVGVVTSAAGSAAIARARADVKAGATVKVDGTEAVVRALG